VLTRLGMYSCQVEASLAQAGVVVGACQLEAPQGDCRRQSATQALEAATLTSCERRHNAVQPQMASQAGELVLCRDTQVVLHNTADTLCCRKQPDRSPLTSTCILR